VLLAGEPGIGKTTLLETFEARARERGLAVHGGRSPAATGAPPFWPWSQVVESIAAGLDDDTLGRVVAGPARPVAQLSPTVTERTGGTVPMTGDNAQSLRFLLYEAVSAFIRRAAGDRPVVITLDDLQWADLPSLELVSYLTPSLSGRPLLLVAAYRDLPADRSEALDATLATVSREDAAEELALGGLGHDDVATLTGDLLGDLLGDLPGAGEAGARERFVTVLHERTGGNPFFVRQLARLIVEAEPGTDDPAAVPVPAGVRHVVASRLAAVSEPTADLLAAAAVLGREFDLRTAAAGAGIEVEAALDALDEAARHGLVEPGTGTGPARRFVHALIQEVVLEQLPPGRAARLHARVARRLELGGNAPADQLAEHMWAGRDVVGTAAVASQLAAAQASAAVFAHERAEAYLRRALHLVRTGTPPDPRSELTVLLSLFRLIASDRGWGDEDARAVVERATELTDAAALDDVTARLWWSLFFFLIDRNDEATYVDVARALLRSITEGPGGDAATGPATRAAVHLMNLFSALAEDDREQAHRHLREARANVEAAPAESLAAYDEHLHVMLLLIEGYWSALHEDAAANRSAISAAVALADADGRPFPRAVARSLGAASAVYAGDPADVHALAGRALDLDHRFGFGWLATVAGTVHDWAEAHVTGDGAGAAAALRGVLDDVVGAGRHGTASTMLLLLADLHSLGGDTSAAREALLRARRTPGPYRGLVVDLVDRKLRALP
jgi:hypothetical protein